jgi:hypothetical protein
MEELQAVASEMLTVAIAAAGIFLAVGFAVNLVGQQVQTLTGNSHGLSRLWARISGMLVGLLLAFFSTPITNAVISALGGG